MNKFLSFFLLAALFLVNAVSAEFAINDEGAFDKEIKQQRMQSGVKLEYAIARYQFWKRLPVTGVCDESTWKYLIPELIQSDEQDIIGHTGYSVLALVELLSANKYLGNRPNGADPFVLDDALFLDVVKWNHKCGVTSVVTDYRDGNVYKRTWSTLMGDHCDLMKPIYPWEAQWPTIDRKSKPSLHVLALKYILYDLGFMTNDGFNEVNSVQAFIEDRKHAGKECPLKFDESTGIAVLQAIKRRTFDYDDYITEADSHVVINDKVWDLLLDNAEIEPTGNVKGDHVRGAVSMMTGHGLYNAGWLISSSEKYGKTYINSMKKFQKELWTGEWELNQEGLVDRATWDALKFGSGDLKLDSEGEVVRAACFLAKYQAGEYPEDVKQKELEK